MLNATLAVHWPKVWNTEDGFELPLALAAAATALAFAGPGRYSIDRALGWNLSGIPYGIGAVALGVVTGLLVYTWRMVQSGRAAASQESLQQGEGQRPAA